MVSIIRIALILKHKTLKFIYKWEMSEVSPVVDFLSHFYA